MKIAICSTGEKIDSNLDQRFGRCNNFLIIELENKQIKKVKAINNAASLQSGGAGEIDLDDQGKIKGYVQKVGTKTIDLDPDQVIHFRINTIADSLTGTGIIEPVTKLIEAKRNIELGLAESVYRHGFPQFHVKLGDKEHQPESERYCLLIDTFKY